MRKILFLIISALMFSSCFTTHNYVGKYAEMTDFGRTNDTLFAQTKQCYVVGGLVPLGQKKVSAPKTNCDIQTKMTFVDALISGCTFGFFLRQTISVKSVVDPNLRPEHIENKKNIPLIGSGWEFDAGVGIPYMCDLSLYYKMNNHLSFGINYAMVYPQERIFVIADCYGVGYSSNYSKEIGFRTTYFTFQSKWTMKGVYRVLNKKFSPIISLGMGMCHFELSHDKWGVFTKTGLCYSWETGISYRFSANRNPNNYFVFKFGDDRVLGKWKADEMYHKEDNGKIKMKVNIPIMMLSFTHTFNSKWSKLEGKGSNWKLPIGD